MRVFWRPSKLCTWFVFHPHNLLSLDPASSSYLISALWDIKYTLILKNCLWGWWDEVRWGDGLLSHLENRFIEIWQQGVDCQKSSEWDRKPCRLYSNNYGIYKCFVCTHHLNKSILDPVQVFLRDGSKDLWHHIVLTWFFWTVSANTSSDQIDALDAETHTGPNFHLSHSQDGLHLGFYDLANGGGSEVIR